MRTSNDPFKWQAMSDEELKYITSTQSKGIKHDNEKPRWSLLPAGCVAAVVRVLTFGSKKYADDNWKLVPDARKRYYDAMHRHIEAWWDGERADPETGEHHMAHAVCCAFFIMWLDDSKK